MGVFDMVDSFFNPQEGYEKAGEAASKYYGQAQGYLDPYNQNALSQFKRLMEQAGLLNDPAKLEGDWAKSYEMSPYAQNLIGQAKESGLDAASSMGLMGSSAALNNIQNSASNIMQSDRQKYMDDLMQKYMASVGIGQNLYGTGASAAGAMSNNAMNQGNTMAQAAYGEQNAPGDMFGKLIGMGVNGAINYATGGLA